MSDSFSESLALELDEKNPLTKLRDEFYLPSDSIYLDGNSLGLLAKSAEAALMRAVEEWKTMAIGGWLDARPPWFELAEHLGHSLSTVVGASPEEVVVANSVTVNLHQILATLYDPLRSADRILIDELAFPTDRYAVESILRLVGKDPAEAIKTVPSTDGKTLETETICEHLTADVQIAILPTVVYTSGPLLQIEPIVECAHANDILIGFDASHSVGVVPHRFREHDVDFGVFCTYKYLNAGPGALAGLYLHERFSQHRPGLAGWFGSNKDQQFAMSPEFTPASGAGGLQIGTPAILAMAPLLGALAVIQKAGIEHVRKQSLQLTGFLYQGIEQELRPLGFDWLAFDEQQRGGHVSVIHPQAASLTQALRATGVIADHRRPDIVRIAPSPLYNTFHDCWCAVESLRSIARTGSYEQFENTDRQIP